MKRLRQFLYLIGSLLFFQGVTSLLFLALSISIPTPWNRLIRPDSLHAWLHVSSAMLIWIGLRQKKVLAVGRSFSLCYLLLGLLGLALHHPLGLLLDKGENLFHLLIAAAGLWLSFRAKQNSKGHFN